MEISNYKVECLKKEAEAPRKSELEYYHDVAVTAVDALFGAYWHSLVAQGHEDDEADRLAEDAVCERLDLTPYQFNDLMYGEDEATAYQDYRHNL